MRAFSIRKQTISVNYRQIGARCYCESAATKYITPAGHLIKYMKKNSFNIIFCLTFILNVKSRTQANFSKKYSVGW